MQRQSRGKGAELVQSRFSGAGEGAEEEMQQIEVQRCRYYGGDE